MLINLYSMVTGQINHSLVIIIGFFSLVNALINPILYGKMSLRYRQGYAYIFKKLLSLCGAQKPDGSFFDTTRRAASTVARHSAAQASYKSAVRKSIEVSNEEDGIQRIKDANSSSTRAAEVRFEVNDKRIENEEDGTHSETFLIEDGNANCLDTSSLQVSAQSEDEEHKKIDSEYTTLDESFDSAL